MRKILTVLFVLLCLSGCGKKQEALNIDIKAKAEELLALDEFKGISIMDNDKAELKYSIDLSKMEEGVIVLPTDAERANMFIIAKAKDESLFDELGMLVDKYEHSWCDVVYNAKEAEKVKNKTVLTIGDYYICVISDDNETIIDKIKN